MEQEYFSHCILTLTVSSDATISFTKSHWKDITGFAWKEYSDNRWFSKFDTLKEVFGKFGDLIPIVTKIADDGISPSNSTKLLILLTDANKLHMLKIELAAYVEGLEDLRNLCYFLEGDWTDMCFKVAGMIKAFQDLFPDGEMKELPSTKVLCKQAIEWALKSIAT